MELKYHRQDSVWAHCLGRLEAMWGSGGRGRGRAGSRGWRIVVFAMLAMGKRNPYPQPCLLEQRLANIFWKRPDIKYFEFCGPYEVSVTYSVFKQPFKM